MLSDQMLYRAVILTLVARWLKDRMYEAGADDIIGLDVFQPLIGDAARGGLTTDEASQWLAVALAAGLGISVFVARAVQSGSMLKRLQVIAGEQTGGPGDTKVRDEISY